MSIIFQAEVIVGTRDEEAAQELVTAAKKIGYPVSASFNGTEMTAFPSSTTEEVMAGYGVLKEMYRKIQEKQ